MSILLDPENNETPAFLELCGDLTGRRVLEVGSGDGRLTWRYANLAAAVTGIEPDKGRVRRARQALPQELRRKVRFFTGDLEQYAARPRKRFDLAVLAWSL